MTLAGWFFTDSWIAVALVLFVVNGTLAMSVVDPHMKKLLAAADEATDGPLDRDLTDLVHDARAFGALRSAVGVAVSPVQPPRQVRPLRQTTGGPLRASGVGPYPENRRRGVAA